MLCWEGAGQSDMGRKEWFSSTWEEREPGGAGGRKENMDMSSLWSVLSSYGSFDSQHFYHAHIKRKPDTCLNTKFVLIHKFI